MVWDQAPSRFCPCAAWLPERLDFTPSTDKMPHRAGPFGVEGDVSNAKGMVEREDFGETATRRSPGKRSIAVPQSEVEKRCGFGKPVGGIDNPVCCVVTAESKPGAPVF